MSRFDDWTDKSEELITLNKNKIDRSVSYYSKYSKTSHEGKKFDNTSKSLFSFFRWTNTSKVEGQINRSVPCYWHEKSQ